MYQAPSERARLYFLLAWFHAIVQERLRYVPLGWSKRYEFSESDLRVACDTLDTWLDAIAQVRVSSSPITLEVKQVPETFLTCLPFAYSNHLLFLLSFQTPRLKFIIFIYIIIAHKYHISTFLS